MSAQLSQMVEGNRVEFFILVRIPCYHSSLIISNKEITKIFRKFEHASSWENFLETDPKSDVIQSYWNVSMNSAWFDLAIELFCFVLKEVLNWEMQELALQMNPE